MYKGQCLKDNGKPMEVPEQEEGTVCPPSWRWSFSTNRSLPVARTQFTTKDRTTEMPPPGNVRKEIPRPENAHRDAPAPVAHMAIEHRR